MNSLAIHFDAVHRITAVDAPEATVGSILVQVNRAIKRLDPFGAIERPFELSGGIIGRPHAETLRGTAWTSVGRVVTLVECDRNEPGVYWLHLACYRLALEPVCSPTHPYEMQQLATAKIYNGSAAWGLAALVNHMLSL